MGCNDGTRGRRNNRHQQIPIFFPLKFLDQNLKKSSRLAVATTNQLVEYHFIGQLFTPHFSFEGQSACLLAWRRELGRDAREMAYQPTLLSNYTLLSAAALGLCSSSSGNSSPAADMVDTCIYHLVQENRWKEAGGEGYLPPTYEADGFIHACHLATHLLPVANNFYTGQESLLLYVLLIIRWLCCLNFRCRQYSVHSSTRTVVATA